MKNLIFFSFLFFFCLNFVKASDTLSAKKDTFTLQELRFWQKCGDLVIKIREGEYLEAEIVSWPELNVAQVLYARTKDTDLLYIRDPD